MTITTPHHVLSRCVFIPNKFPTLLAEREIIANASLLVRISPRTAGKVTKKSATPKGIAEKCIVYLIYTPSLSPQASAVLEGYYGV